MSMFAEDLLESDHEVLEPFVAGTAGAAAPLQFAASVAVKATVASAATRCPEAVCRAS